MEKMLVDFIYVVEGWDMLIAVVCSRLMGRFVGGRRRARIIYYSILVANQVNIDTSTA